MTTRRSVLSGPFKLFLLLIFAMQLTTPAKAQDLSIYSDSLQNGWQNWSWATTNLSNTSPVHSAPDSISVTAGAWAALYLHASTQVNTSAYTGLRFWINGGSAGGQLLQVAATLNGNAQASYTLSALTTGWQQITIPLTSLGAANATNMDGFNIQDRTGTSQATFYVDDISLVSAPVGNVTIDASANVHPISPYIYGVNWGSTAQLSDLNSSVNRSGGNANSRYNWKINATNRGGDWYFESLPGASSTPGADEDDFVTTTKAGGAEPMLTVPIIGWVAKLGPNRSGLAAFSVAKYGAQKSTDPWWADAGNGVLANGSNVTGNDPNDANVPADVDFVKPDLTRIVTKFGQGTSGGVKFYILDNEPGVWLANHRDVHPIGPKMDELLNDIKTYGSAVKAADPTAQVLATEEWGWPNIINSAYDGQNPGGTDRAAHNNMDQFPYLLQQMSQYDATVGHRTLDYLSWHFYTSGTNEQSSDASAPTALLRNRSTRQLWDPNYLSESWINAKQYIIPRMKGWINTYYPGTKTAITEYDWGGEGSMNGATAEADILGIFGQQGLDLATRWGGLDSTDPSYQAMKMYRNYDGNKSTFGDTSVGTTVVNPDYLSAFAATRGSDHALTIMVINKGLSGTTPVTLNIANFNAKSTAHVWQLSSSTITQQADVSVSSGTITLTVPSPSVTLFVVPTALTAPAAPTNLTAKAGNA